ncbi:hypothetical protein BJ138DRAFT_1018176 [Hygrophoropsis aurantiaca]|uniref:Uncharacterized protein n=1 Tax=Hygrophoropsis aurantiaca TaxID=72124 RepID=A0ACB7ZVF6_9AGAM|nr:hypothetical protein BJ138DRAFT_1018176 [Hygrophoropsis aurantiaca]
MLIVNPDWEDLLQDLPCPSDSESRGVKFQCHLVFTLIVYLNLSLRDFLFFLFESSIPSVRQRAGTFMGNNPTWEVPFAPARMYQAWHSRFPRCVDHLHDTIVKQCAEEIILKESNCIISEKTLKVKQKQCTMESIRTTLDPGKLVAQYREFAPFTWALLLIFTTVPNAHRKQKAAAARRRKAAVHGDHTGLREESESEPDSWIEDMDGGDSWGDGFSGETGEDWKAQGFVRNATFTLVFVISMMAFTRNGATNLFAMVLGLFLEIGGTSSRVISTLSNAGVCVSTTTIERLKKVLSDDAKHHAVQLMQGSDQFMTIFDNINIYLRKFQQRLFNKNSMIHATNVAVVALHDVSSEAGNLSKKLENRGKRSAATGDDIKPTLEDEQKIFGSFKGLVTHFILAYCPGNESWKDRPRMIKIADELMASDRPLPVRKSDTRPLGMFDVDEGSKKGIINVLKSIQEISGLTEEEWSGKVRIIAGDWLTTSNLRSARRDRNDDINSMERLEYPEDLSQLFHFALNASHMMMRLHFGNAINDPGSLAKHKGLLNRTWDAAKLNYADGKALIRHSLIARILYTIMLKNGMTRWSELAKWKPEEEEVSKFVQEFVLEYTNPSTAENAKAIQDDWRAHSVYFIRDTLLFCEFEHAVSHADAGRVLRVLKYWSFSFRGAGLHNYARECIEILLRWKYELSPELRAALEQSWFINRWGLPGRWIAADLYLEQLNFWVKRVFIAKGSGVTLRYIIEKGSACVEAFREISHLFARTFGYADRARRHKEVDIGQDLRLLTEDMFRARLHVPTADRGVLTAAKVNKKTGKVTVASQSAIVDCFDTGIQLLNDGKFSEFIHTTTWDPAVGYPVDVLLSQAEATDVLRNGSIFDSVDENPITRDDFDDIDDGDTHKQRCPGLGSLGGGMDYADSIV